MTFKIDNKTIQEILYVIRGLWQIVPSNEKKNNNYPPIYYKLSKLKESKIIPFEKIMNQV